MITHKHLWELYILKKNFEIACENSQKKKQKQAQIKEFNKDRDGNLKEVWEYATSGRFHTSPYRKRTIYEPKERDIYILPYCPDRITQHAVINVLKPVIERRLIQNTYSSFEGRGQIAASLKCSEFVRKFDYCFQGDIHKFYPSIVQQTLSDMTNRIIRDERFMDVVDDIIFSFPGARNCPIGNPCSPLFGNFYLSRLDNFVLHGLKAPAYERFCDDFLIFSNDKHFLTECRKRVENFLYKELGLSYSKANVFNTKQGVDFCGYRHFKKYVLIRKRTATRMKRRLRGIEENIENGDVETVKALGQVASANGLMKHACSHNLRESVHYEEILNKLNGGHNER